MLKLHKLQKLHKYAYCKFIKNCIFVTWFSIINSVKVDDANFASVTVLNTSINYRCCNSLNSIERWFYSCYHYNMKVLISTDFVFAINRSSHLRCYIKRLFLINFAIFTAKHLYWNLFLLKLRPWRIQL